MEERVCCICKTLKKSLEFYKDKTKPTGYESTCKSCRYTRIFSVPPAGFLRCSLCKNYKEKDLFEKSKQRLQGYTSKCKNCLRLRHRIKKKEQKTKLLEYYGNKCQCCGETEKKFLTVDHIYGGGNQHNKSINGHIYSWLIANNYPEGFQILCYNCNCAKGHYGQCPHLVAMPLGG